ncbi:MAG: hypothetical protein IJY72_03620 [Akkermansia sp.]|nr:hypothetical protein [Akkermansia sp.]
MKIRYAQSLSLPLTFFGCYVTLRSFPLLLCVGYHVRGRSGRPPEIAADGVFISDFRFVLQIPPAAPAAELKDFPGGLGVGLTKAGTFNFDY